MKNQKETKIKIMSKIEELKAQISNISSQIERDREENDADDSSILHELLDKKEILEHNINDLLESLRNGDLPEHIGREYTVSINGFDRSFQVVHPSEANSQNGKISIDSPLAQALLGNDAGDAVDVSTPGGIQTFKILSVV